MDVFQFGILLLLGLAVSDLVVGVSNDAVNFLNSSIGSRVASRRVIMIIASLGILAGGIAQVDVIVDRRLDGRTFGGCLYRLFLDRCLARFVEQEVDVRLGARLSCAQLDHA